MDTDSQRVFQASRSESPALLFANDVTDGAFQAVRTLPDTTGSWEMTVSGDILAVDTNGNGSVGPQLVLYDAGSLAEIGSFPLPSTTSASGYVMALAPDPSIPGAFWIGTYDADGANLYHFRSRTGRFTNYSPGNEWAKLCLKYVRSLTATRAGVFVGMGNPASVWALASGPKTPVRLDSALSGLDASTVYALAVTPLPEEGQAARVVAGTNSPASVQVLDEAGANVYSCEFGPEEATVDRVVVDEANVAWFTLRPTGDLYRLNLENPYEGPTNIGHTVLGAETRALSAAEGVVRGVTGTRQLWTYDSASRRMSTVKLSRGGTPEGESSAAQGILLTSDAALVSGHWRYQVHTTQDSFDIDIPGEPKAQVRVGERVFSAIYPSASVFEVDVENQIATFLARTPNSQVRPRSLVYSEDARRLYMGASSPYGTYGGGISQVDPDTGDLTLFDTPVARQFPSSLAPLGRDLIVGTSAAGEAVAAPAGARTHIVRWTPEGGGETIWDLELPTSYAVDGLAITNDGAGDFIFATTAGRTYTVDAGTGDILWAESLGGRPNHVTAVGNYVLLRNADQLIEFFPTRSALTRGLTLADPVSWADLEPGPDGTLEVGTVVRDPSVAQRARIAHPREVQRLRGEDRYLTAIAVSQSTFAAADSAVIATGRDFPDALTAGPLAAALDGPVLLNRGSRVLAGVVAELRRLGVSNVYISGGAGVIPVSVEREMVASGFKVKRLSGKDRYGTAESIAEELRSVRGVSSIPVILATGRAFPDSLSATPAAAKMGAAILLTNANTITRSTLAYLKSSKAGAIAVVGGPARRAVERARLRVQWTASGVNRYATSALVSERVGHGPVAYVATGRDYPDALAAGPVAAHFRAPVLLSAPTALSGPVQAELTVRDVVRMVGGSGVLAPGLAMQIRNLD